MHQHCVAYKHIDLISYYTTREECPIFGTVRGFCEI